MSKKSRAKKKSKRKKTRNQIRREKYEKLARGNKKGEGGFSFFELILVVVIIGMLTAIIMPIVLDKWQARKAQDKVMAIQQKQETNMKVIPINNCTNWNLRRYIDDELGIVCYFDTDSIFCLKLEKPEKE